MTEAPPGEARFADTLAAYRRAKWAQLHDEGEESLLAELARLEAALADPEWGGGRVLHVDNDFRRAKVRVLREVLRDAGGESGAAEPGGLTEA